MFCIVQTPICWAEKLFYQCLFYFCCANQELILKLFLIFLLVERIACPTTSCVYILYVLLIYENCIENKLSMRHYKVVYSLVWLKCSYIKVRCLYFYVIKKQEKKTNKKAERKKITNTESVEKKRVCLI